MSASVGHGRLVLLQAAASLMMGLAQQPKSRQQLLQADVSETLVNLALQVCRAAHGYLAISGQLTLTCGAQSGKAGTLGYSKTMQAYVIFRERLVWGAQGL